MLSFFSRDVLDDIWDLIGSVSEGFPTYFRKTFSQFYRRHYEWFRGLTGVFRLLQNFSVAISVSLMFVLS